MIALDELRPSRSAWEMFAMGKRIRTAGLFLLSIALSIDPALAHHVMGGHMPVTFADGLLSGLAHPIIGFDHFAAVVAVACLASAACNVLCHEDLFLRQRSGGRMVVT